MQKENPTQSSKPANYLSNKHFVVNEAAKHQLIG